MGKKKPVKRRKKSVSVPILATLGGATAVAIMIPGLSRNFPALLRNAIQQFQAQLGKSGLPTQGVFGALTAAAAGGLASSAIYTVNPNARLKIGKYILRP